MLEANGVSAEDIQTYFQNNAVALEESFLVEAGYTAEQAAKFIAVED